MSKEEKGEVEENEEEQENEQSQEENEFVTKKEFDEIKSSLVEEIKEVRKAKQEAEADRDLLSKENEQEEEKDEVDKKIEQALSQKEKEEIERRKASAEKKFKQKNKELMEDADKSGIKWEAVQEQLGRLNTSKANTEEEFMEFYEDAYRLAKRDSSSTSNKRGTTPYASDSNAAKQSSGPEESTDGISARESEVIERIGWTKEKFLEQKKRRPAYVNRLINSPY